MGVDAILSNRVENNPALSRYELAVEGGIAIAAYRLAPGRIIFHHTETPAHLRGRGIATALIKGALEDVRARNLTVEARCPFVEAFLRDHPEFHDLLR